MIGPVAGAAPQDWCPYRKRPGHTQGPPEDRGGQGLRPRRAAPRDPHPRTDTVPRAGPSLGGGWAGAARPGTLVRNERNTRRPRSGTGPFLLQLRPLAWTGFLKLQMAVYSEACSQGSAGGPAGRAAAGSRRVPGTDGAADGARALRAEAGVPAFSFHRRAQNGSPERRGRRAQGSGHGRRRGGDPGRGVGAGRDGRGRARGGCRGHSAFLYLLNRL